MAEWPSPSTPPTPTHYHSPPPCIQLSLISWALQNVLFEKRAQKKRAVPPQRFVLLYFFYPLLLDLHLHIEGAAAGCAENPARARVCVCVCSLRVLVVGCKLFKADWVCSARRQVEPPPPPHPTPSLTRSRGLWVSQRLHKVLFSGVYGTY